MDIDRVMKWDEKVPSISALPRVCSIFITDRREKSCTQTGKRSSVRSAKREKCVIVGRNANTILKNFEDSLHVFYMPDPYWRMEHMKAKCRI